MTNNEVCRYCGGPNTWDVPCSTAGLRKYRRESAKCAAPAFIVALFMATAFVVLAICK